MPLTLSHSIENCCITWLIDACAREGTKLSEVLTVEAIELLSERLRTPLQIEQHLMLAMEAAYHVGEKPITGAIVESVLSKQIDELEPKLTRHGYDVISCPANSL